MGNFPFLVQTRPAVCARALLVFLLACACSVFYNAGQFTENSSQRVLIVLVLSFCGNGRESEASETPVDDRRAGTAIWLNPGVVPPPTPAVALKEPGVCQWAHLLRQCHAYVHGGSHVP